MKYEEITKKFKEFIGLMDEMREILKLWSKYKTNPIFFPVGNPEEFVLVHDGDPVYTVAMDPETREEYERYVCNVSYIEFIPRGDPRILYELQLWEWLNEDKTLVEYYTSVRWPISRDYKYYLFVTAKVVAETRQDDIWKVKRVREVRVRDIVVPWWLVEYKNVYAIRVGDKYFEEYVGE